jgi:hypothetical protein
VKRLRRTLLELWAIVLLAGIVGFLGPFGTYQMGDFLSRVGRWWGMLMGAYVLVRPAILFLRWIAKATDLPRGSLVFWGVILAAFPMNLLWQALGRQEVRALVGFGGLLPFSFLCSLAILTVVWWAERADLHLLRYYDSSRAQRLGEGLAAARIARPAAGGPSSRPRLYQRLGPGFQGDILALESEDHYVRVHGAGQSELLFIRLRDAIAEMDGHPGEHIHRSWWVARDAVADVSGNGRNREIRLVNGLRAPVARDSVDRLRRAGFLPA